MADIKISQMTEVFDVQDTDVIPLVRGGLNKRITGANIKTSLNAYAVKISLTSAQIKTGNSVPVQLVAPAGTGTMIEFISGTIVNNFNTTAFDGTGDANIIIDTAAIMQAQSIGIIQATATQFQRFVIISDANNQLVENKGLYLSLGADSTVGDGSMDVYIYYRVITL